MREQVLGYLASPDGVLVLDESDFVKENARFVGAHRVYGASVGSPHLQTGVFLAYCGPRGRGYLDRELFLPRAWVEHRDLRAASGVPGDVGFCTRPEMARRMLQRALEHQVPHRYVAGGPTFGADAGLRRWLQEKGEPYVLGVPGDLSVTTNGRIWTVRALAESLPEDAWHSRAGSSKATGLWSATPVQDRGNIADARGGYDPNTWNRWVVAWRPTADSEEIECFLAHTVRDAGADELCDVIEAYRRVRQGLREARDSVGLDRFAGRNWDGWYRHMTVALMAHTVLCMARETCGADTGRAGTGDFSPLQ
jgi:SRSO17 transposase